jgi:anti-anti-sigma factor
VDPDRERAPWSWDGHLLLLHRTELERQSRLASWVRHGLDRGEKVIYTEARPGGAVLALLESQGIDVTAATSAGHLEVLPLAEFFAAAYQLTLIEQALAQGFPAVRVSAESGDALRADAGAFAGFEAGIQQLVRAHRVSALCQYDVGATTGQALEEIAGSHLDGVRETQFQSSEHDRGLVLAGEIDFTNDEILGATLRAATAAASGVFRLDISGVTFISSGGLRAVASSTQKFRDDGGNLVLVGPQPRVERTIRLLGVDQLDRVIVDRDPR